MFQLYEPCQTVQGMSLSATHAESTFSTGGTRSRNLEGSDEAEPPGILSSLD